MTDATEIDNECECEDGATVLDPSNIHIMSGVYEEKGVMFARGDSNVQASDILNNGISCNDNIVVESPVSEQNVGNNSVNMPLEDYKCPICLDTFINTVKVDCCYGHKFCNFCIQCWINFERHLVTECPVCRGPIFGKRLDLKTDAEIRAIYDSLSDEEKKSRLLSIKERLQLEYPNSNIQLISNDFEIPMRISDASYHNFNHDLNVPIPLIGFVPGEPLQFTSNSQENVGESNEQAFWPQEMMYWDNSFARDYQYINNMSMPQLHEAQHVELDHSNVRHQHYRHQNQENSLWDNDLYVTADDTRNFVSPPGVIPTVLGSELQYINQINAPNRQNQFPEDTSGGQYQTAYVIQQHPHQRSPQHASEEYTFSVNSNSATPTIPRNVSPQNQFPITVYPSSPSALQSPSQAAAPNGFYCCYCYFPSCPNNHCYPTHSTQTHCVPTSSMLQFQVQGTNSHQGISNSNGCPGNRQSHCHYTSTPLHGNFWNTVSGNIPATSYFPPPNSRPNMSGASSTPVQLPSPNNITLAQAQVSQMIPEVNSRRTIQSPPYYQTSSVGGAGSNSSEMATTAAYHNSQWRTRQSGNFHERNSSSGRSRTPVASSSARISTNGHSHQQSRTRQSVPVSTCPIARHNNRAHFSGGFSLFSVGHINFQICHTPKTAMVAGRQVTMPPGRLTHPLVSLIPMNQDGSSTRVSLTFEVHRV